MFFIFHSYQVVKFTETATGSLDHLEEGRSRARQKLSHLASKYLTGNDEDIKMIDADNDDGLTSTRTTTVTKTVTKSRSPSPKRRPAPSPPKTPSYPSEETFGVAGRKSRLASAR